MCSKMPLERVDPNAERDIKAAREASSSCLSWNVVQIQPQDLSRGQASSALGKARALTERPVRPPHPISRECPLSGSRGLSAQAASRLTKPHIWGMFHTGKRARHSEGEATTLPCKGPIELLQKRNFQPLSSPSCLPSS